MTREKMFQIFKRNNSRKMDCITPNATFIHQYGNMSFEEAFAAHMLIVDKGASFQQKIAAFEAHLLSSGAQRVDSSRSESRYYYHNGIKYRFSCHIYPTGTMSTADGNVVDFAADPALIENISF